MYIFNWFCYVDAWTFRGDTLTPPHNHTHTGYLYGIVGAIGVTAGAHRLWAHGAYKATWPLRGLLMLMQTMAFQNCIWEWVRDHRYLHRDWLLIAFPNKSSN